MKSDDISIADELYLEEEALQEPLSYQRLETVLVIEDDADFGRALATRLTKEGLNVSLAADGQCGVEKIVQLEPDVVLLDLGLPRMNGFKVLEQLRQSSLTCDVPIVVITGRTDPELERKMENWGVEHVFRKPVRQRELVRSVMEILDGEA